MLTIGWKKTAMLGENITFITRLLAAELLSTISRKKKDSYKQRAI